MAKFINAFCNNNGQIYSVKELNGLEKSNPILKDLHCTNCNCLLTFHHAGKREAYLATKSGCKHTEECEKKVRIEIAKKRRKNKYVGNEPLTRLQQARLAKAGYKAIMNHRQYKKRNNTSVSKHVNKSSQKSIHQTYRPVASSGSNVKSGNKHEKMHTRTPLVAFTNIGKYIGQAIKVAGKITKVKVGKHAHTAKLYLEWKGSKTSIFLNEATFRNSAAGLAEALNELNYQIQHNHFKAITCAVVDVIPNSKGQPVCMLRTDDGFVVNGYGIRIALR